MVSDVALGIARHPGVVLDPAQFARLRAHPVFLHELACPGGDVPRATAAAAMLHGAYYFEWIARPAIG